MTDPPDPSPPAIPFADMLAALPDADRMELEQEFRVLREAIARHRANAQELREVAGMPAIGSRRLVALGIRINYIAAFGAPVAAYFLPTVPLLMTVGVLVSIGAVLMMVGGLWMSTRRDEVSPGCPSTPTNLQS